MTKETVHQDATPIHNPEISPLPTTNDTHFPISTEIELTADINTGHITITPKPNQQAQPVNQSGKQHGGEVVQQLPLLLPDFDNKGGLNHKQRIFIGYHMGKRITQLQYRSEKHAGILNSFLIQHGVCIKWRDRFCALLRVKTSENMLGCDGLISCIRNLCLIPKNLSKSLMSALNITRKKLIEMEYLSLCVDHIHVKLRALPFPYKDALVKTTMQSGGLIMVYENLTYLLFRDSDTDTLANYFVDE